MFTLLLLLSKTLVTAASFDCFQQQYVMDKSFAKGIAFSNVSDITFNVEHQHVLVLQRSYPIVTVWSANGSLVLSWTVSDIGSPHSITLNGSNPTSANVWITDLYNHCVRVFTYNGKYLNSIGECGQYTNGSGLNPPQFDKVTDVAFNSRGYIYVTDGDIGGLNNRVLVFDKNIQLVDVWNKGNKPGNEPLQFNLPHSVIVDTCDRVWIVDTKNYRLQIVSDEGMFLGQWDCFGTVLVYGIDLVYQEGSSYILLTTKAPNGNSEVLFIPLNFNNCAELEECTIKRRLSLHTRSSNIPAMLHAVTFNNNNSALYFAMLPGVIPPLKYDVVPPPPVSNTRHCSSSGAPPTWHPSWNSTVLLTAFNASELMTGNVQYSANLNAMYIVIKSTAGVKKYLNVGNETYIPHKGGCFGPYNFGWVTPPREFLSSYNCECKGSLEISGTQKTAWRCQTYKVADWYWFDKYYDLRRIFFNNHTNPTHLPVLGDFALVHFGTYGSGVASLLKAFQMCIANKEYKGKLLSHSQLEENVFVRGFSTDCSGVTTLPSWPQRLHMTVTMLPVLQDFRKPLPTSVVYDWQRRSQRTVMCETNTNMTYNAYMVVNKTYIVEEAKQNSTVKCISDLDFGPVRPNWMTLDNCKCMGTIKNNLALSPWNFTVIATCPLIGDRVFWTWFTNDTGFAPLLFAETLTPPNEGTGLSLADYHKFYSEDVLIDLLDFSVPKKCSQEVKV